MMMMIMMIMMMMFSFLKINDTDILHTTEQMPITESRRLSSNQMVSFF